MPKKSLLMVDQDSHYAKIYANRFESAGWKVWVEETIVNARKRLKRSVPHVVMIDLEPLDEALAFLKELRADERTASSLQIALATKGNRQTMLKAQEAGVDRYILKGHFVPAEAVKQVKHLLEEKTSL